MEKWDDDTYKLGSYACLNCGREMDAATMIPGMDKESAEPHPGAISVCLKCGHVAAFTDDLILRELNDEEIVGLAGDEGFKRTMKVMGDFNVWTARRERVLEKFGIIDPKKMRYFSDDERICGYEASGKYMVAFERRNGRIKRMKFDTEGAAQIAIAALIFTGK